MDKESKYLLQKIDCNCNDCGFMTRDFATYSKWESFFKQLQLNDFNRDKSRKEDKSFQFDKSYLLNYGICEKLKKSVSFSPNTCQIHTQECFVHRLDMLSEEERNKKLGL